MKKEVTFELREFDGTQQCSFRYGDDETTVHVYADSLLSLLAKLSQCLSMEQAMEIGRDRP